MENSDQMAAVVGGEDMIGGLFFVLLQGLGVWMSVFRAVVNGDEDQVWIDCFEVVGPEVLAGVFLLRNDRHEGGTRTVVASNEDFGSYCIAEFRQNPFLPGEVVRIVGKENRASPIGYFQDEHRVVCVGLVVSPLGRVEAVNLGLTLAMKWSVGGWDGHLDGMVSVFVYEGAPELHVVFVILSIRALAGLAGVPDAPDGELLVYDATTLRATPERSEVPSSFFI